MKPLSRIYRGTLSRLGRPSRSAHPVRTRQQEAPSIIEPVYLSLTPSLRKARWDPPAKDSVAILEPTVFKHPIRRDIIHLCVVHYRDSLRQGSANTKTRGEVRGSGRKIRQQKGSGKARLGDAQSPMLRSGGVAFGPKPRDFSTKLPRKVIEMGMRTSLSLKLREQHLGVMKRLYWPDGKTKHLSQRINELGLLKTLFVSGEPVIHEGLRRAINNIRQVKLMEVKELDVYQIMKWERIILDFKAVEYLEERLTKVHVPKLPISILSPESSLEQPESPQSLH